MAFTFADLVNTGVDTVEVTGSAIMEFYEVISSLPLEGVDHARVLPLIQKAGKISGYSQLYARSHRPPAGTLLGHVAGRTWFAEPNQIDQIDWGDCGLNVQQLQFARELQHAVALLFAHQPPPAPAATARFDEALVGAIRRYDLMRTDRINYLEAEYRLMRDVLPIPGVTGMSISPPIDVSIPITDPDGILFEMNRMLARWPRLPLHVPPPPQEVSKTLEALVEQAHRDVERVLGPRPGDVLREQSVKAREMHEQTGAPLINVPITDPDGTVREVPLSYDGAD